jgi:NAD dependent epimerase/dehydratase family enzyme
MYGSRWASTAAITSLVITSSTGTLISGSTATLYGVHA